MPPPNFKNLIGKKFGRLTVISRSLNDKRNKARWECLCACGNITVASSSPLIDGRTKSCGCIRKEKIIDRVTTHGMSKCSEYRIWKGILHRCYNKNNHAFKHYGGRGITICDEWRHDFLAFYNHIGVRPSKNHSIDRINNDRNYEIGNVKWSTSSEQASNTTRNIIITLHGWSLNMSQWAIFTNIKPATLRKRINSGWPPAKAIFKPVRKHKPYFSTAM